MYKVSCPNIIVLGFSEQLNWYAQIWALSKASKNTCPNCGPPSIGIDVSAAPFTWNTETGLVDSSKGRLSISWETIGAIALKWLVSIANLFTIPDPFDTPIAYIFSRFKLL